MGVHVGVSGTGASVGTERREDFDTFARRCGPDLRRVLVGLGVVVVQDPAPGAHVAPEITVRLDVCGVSDTGLQATTLPVVECRTEFATNEGPMRNAKPPTSVLIGTPPVAFPKLTGFSDSQGWLTTTAPAGWLCSAFDTPSRTSVEMRFEPPGQPHSCCGATPLERSLSAFNVAGGCEACVWVDVCAIVPHVEDDFPKYPGPGCQDLMPGTKVTRRGEYVYEVDFPATKESHATREVLRYTPKTAIAGSRVAGASCSVPPSEQRLCDTLLEQFLQLN